MNIKNLLDFSGTYKIYEKYLSKQIQKQQKPQHIGIILDGNRRWAQNSNKPRWFGHYKGAETANNLMTWCQDLDIKIITLYVLSAENYNRKKEELNELFNLIYEKLDILIKDKRIHNNKIRVKALGNRKILPEKIIKILENIEKQTENYSDNYLNIAIAYGGRNEILNAIKKITEDIKLEKINAEQISEKLIEKYLDTSHLPKQEPELIIRTSGEARLSGFLLWQSAYSELVFLDVYWPDFRKIDLMRAIRTYQKRSRRLGE